MPAHPPGPQKTLHEVAQQVGIYPPQAYEFLQEGLAFTVKRIHGTARKPDTTLHITGRQLCEGLRDFALLHWGKLSRVVLARWNIHRTEDFGRMVFALVEAGHLHKTEADSFEDFRRVFDFAKVFEDSYSIELKT